jgi:hypothetical protein
MLIRTLCPTEIAGRHCRAFACLDLPEAEAQALIDAGQAEPWEPLDRGARPAVPSDALAAEPQE